MKAVAWLLGVGTLVGAGIFTGLSVVRWEWNRAFFFGLVFLAAQMALATALVLKRLGEIQPEDGRRGGHELETLRSTRGDHVRFEWLRVDHREAVNRSSVFITLLVGSGVVLTGLAWALDKLGAATTDRRREERLADELRAIRYPEGGLLVDEATALAGGHSDAHADHVRAIIGDRRVR